jgi:hypothetical protein
MRRRFRFDALGVVWVITSKEYCRVSSWHLGRPLSLTLEIYEIGYAQDFFLYSPFLFARKFLKAHAIFERIAAQEYRSQVRNFWPDNNYRR